jgi:prophage antirepressor-like protein
MSQLIEYTQSEALKQQFPEFQKLEIYGTEEDPLFVGTHIQDLLCLTKINYTRDLQENKDYVKTLCKNKDGAEREQNLFTERGLYCMMFKSHTEVAERFKDFVTIVLKELRMRGQVMLKTALSKLQLAHDKQTAYLKAVETQCDEIHDRLQTEEARAERYLSKYETAENRLRHLECEVQTDHSFDSTLVEALKQRYLKKIYFTQYDAEDETEPVEDENCVWTMSLNDPKSDAFTFNVWVHSKDTLKSFREELEQANFGYASKNKKTTNKVYGSMADLTNFSNERILR